MLSGYNADKSEPVVFCEVKLDGKLWGGAATPSLLTFGFTLAMKTTVHGGNEMSAPAALA